MKNRNLKESKSFTCSNPMCKRGFAIPLTVHNFCSGNSVRYLGCPYCLTRIEESLESEKEEQTFSAGKDVIEDLKTKLIETKRTLEPFSKKCPHHLGYLSQHSREENMPEECMICENLIECSLKNNS
jgi:hypothetical protein